MKVKVPVFGAPLKAIIFDPDSGARAEAAVAALQARINAGLGSSILHSSLKNLQVGDDHPQYTGNAFPETITGQWNFSTIPFIQGDTLAEYIEDVVGGSFFDFIQDTTSITWQYADTAGHIEANVVPEFVMDTIGAILTDTSSIDLVYNDGANTISANIIDEYVQDLVGAMATDSASIDFTYNDAAGTLTAAIIDEYVQDLVGAMATDSTSIDFTYNDAAGTLTATIIDEYVQDLVGAMFVDSSSIDFTYNDAAGTITAAVTAGFSGANPSASVGLTAVNGSATTYMRSDGAPALSQSISPTWTGDHTFTGAFTLSNTQPEAFWIDTDAAANGKIWAQYANGTHFLLSALSDNLATEAKIMDTIRSTTTLTSTEFGAAQIFVQGGSSSSAPGLSNSGDPNTGVAWLFADVLSLVAGGTEVMRALNDSSGRGILCNGYMRWGNPLSPAQITSNQNDYNPSGLDSAGALRVSTDASRNITGLQTQNLNGRVIPILNVGANPVVLKNEDAGSTAAYRFSIGADITIASKHGVTLWYDSSDTRWRCCGFY